jgi:hypothetical protein
MADDDENSAPHYQIMDADREVVCIMLDISRYDKIHGCGGPPDLWSVGPPASLHIDDELWKRFQHCLGQNRGILPNQFEKTFVLAFACVVPAQYWWGQMGTDDPPATVYTVLLFIYLTVMAVIAWKFSKSANAEMLEHWKAGVESIAEELQAAGYAIELVQEKWYYYADATYVRCTPTAMIPTGTKNNSDEELGTRLSM